MPMYLGATCLPIAPDGNSLFEIAFRAKPVEIPIDDGHGDHLATEPIGHGAIPFLKRTHDSDVVPSLSVPDIAQTEIVLHGPEERYDIAALALAKNIPGCYLTLTFRDPPMLDAYSLAGKAVRPAGDVAGGEDPWLARLEVFVDGHLAIDGEPGLFRQCDRRLDAYPDDDEIGFETCSVFPASRPERRSRQPRCRGGT